MDVARASAIAERLLKGPLPRRWAHSQGVAARAEELTRILGEDVVLLHSAAWLHDIGYSPSISHTGFHPLDGARYLRDEEDADPRLCSLVAHHTCALIEAEERSLDKELSREFPLEVTPLMEALTYCDITTTPTGEETTPQARIEEILSRYGPTHLVSRSIRRAAPALLSAATAVEERVST